MYDRMSLAELDAELGEYVDDLASKWWWFLVGGIVSVLFALWILFWHDWSEDSVTIFLGVFLLVWGGFRLATSLAYYGDARWWLMLSGAAGIGFGITAFVWPTSLVVLANIVALWLIVSGVLNVIAGLTRSREPRWLFVVWGVLAGLIGIWLLGNEALTLVTIIFFIGISALLFGTMEIIASFQIKGLRKDYERARTEVYGQLNTLGDLHAKGVLTDEEYAREKAKIFIG
ncbi:MAG: hypothetical protein BMS9Abin07_1006 [Acidimicrobiia bacterium]|nr:MAG: hypothetical protein BMS9Abin07_1006 [Acidimicrobiia bacterium]